MIENLRKKLGASAQIRLEIVDQIPPEPSGKFRIVRSLLGHSPYEGLDWTSHTPNGEGES